MRTLFLERPWTTLKHGLVGVLLLSAVTGAVAADPRPGPTIVPQSRAFAPPLGISIDQATAIARQQTGGRVLSAAPQTQGTRTAYRIRLLVDGQRVVTVVVDAEGRIKNKR